MMMITATNQKIDALPACETAWYMIVFHSSPVTIRNVVANAMLNELKLNVPRRCSPITGWTGRSDILVVKGGNPYVPRGITSLHLDGVLVARIERVDAAAEELHAANTPFYTGCPSGTTPPTTGQAPGKTAHDDPPACRGSRR